MAEYEDNLFIGKGGEFAVASELLFNKFNANILSVDSGVDIAAIKGGETFLFQVKTGYWNKRRQINVNLEKRKIKQLIENPNMFLIVVCKTKDLNTNEFLIFPIKKIEEFANRQKIKKNRRGEDLVRLPFQKTKNDITLNACKSMNEFINAWDKIKI